MNKRQLLLLNTQSWQGNVGQNVKMLRYLTVSLEYFQVLQPV